MRYIDADELQKDGWKLHREKHGLATSTFETMELDCVPSADVRENVKGTWKIYCDDKGVVEDCYCDQCGFNSVIGGNYCPNCGADMRGEA